MIVDRIRDKLFFWLKKRIYAQLHEQDIKSWEAIYGDFDKTDYEDFTMHNLPNEATFAFGEIVKWAQDIDPPPKRTLLSGEDKNVVKYYKNKINTEEICTAGLLDVDCKWNFENDPPAIGTFDLIISQAILEHLLNPYTHISDLASLLNRAGFLIIHSQGSRHP